MAPAGGNDSPSELIYGLHAVREALRDATTGPVRGGMLEQQQHVADAAFFA